MKHIFALFTKDFKLFFKNTGAVILTFLVPMALIFIFGLVFGGFGKQSGINPITVVVVDKDNSDLSKKFISNLNALKEIKIQKNYLEKDKKIKFDEKTLKNFIKKGKRKVGIVIPKGFKKKIISGKKPTLKILYDPKFRIEYGIINGLSQKILMSKFPQLLYNSMFNSTKKYLGENKNKLFENDIYDVVKKYFNLDKDTKLSDNTSYQSKIFSQEPVNIKSEKLVGEDIKNPMFAQSVAGMAVMFLLFSLSRAGSSILEEKNSGTLNRLLVAPVSSGSIILSKLLFASFLGVLQLSVMFIFGKLVFGLEIFSHIITLLIMIIATSFAASGLGMFIAAISKNQSQVGGLTTLIALGMSALGGSMFPSIIMPEYLQQIGKFTLNYWAMHGFTGIFWRSMSIKDIYPDALVLFAIFVVLTLVSIILFRKKMFAR